jgi:hypothetical protein
MSHCLNDYDRVLTTVHLTHSYSLSFNEKWLLGLSHAWILCLKLQLSRVFSVWRLPARSLAHFRLMSLVSVSLPSSLSLHTFCITSCSRAAHTNLETAGKNTNGVAVSWDESKTHKNTEDDGHTPTHPLGPALAARWVKGFHLPYGDWSCVDGTST